MAMICWIIVVSLMVDICRPGQHNEPTYPAD